MCVEGALSAEVIRLRVSYNQTGLTLQRYTYIYTNVYIYIYIFIYIDIDLYIYKRTGLQRKSRG